MAAHPLLPGLSALCAVRIPPPVFFHEHQYRDVLDNSTGLLRRQWGPGTSEPWPIRAGGAGRLWCWTGWCRGQLSGDRIRDSLGLGWEREVLLQRPVQ